LFGIFDAMDSFDQADMQAQQRRILQGKKELLPRIHLPKHTQRKIKAIKNQ